MNSAASFVELRRVALSYSTPSPMWRRLVRSATAAHSVLRDVNLSLNIGDRVTLIGHAGSGKSTLLRLLTGVLKPTAGTIRVNGVVPGEDPLSAAGYVSAEESEPRRETVTEVLHAFGVTHSVRHLPARIGEIGEFLNLQPLLYRPAETLSTVERLRLNLARAALVAAPIVLLDDIADHLGGHTVAALSSTLFAGRTMIVATRQPAVADALGWPLLTLHRGTILPPATATQLAEQLQCPRVVDVWIEGVRYDLLRALRHQAGVTDVRLLPSSDFSGQRLRLQLHSSRYLPAVYDAVSRAPLVRIEETPVTTADLLAKLN